MAVKGVGESTGELGGSISPAHLGLEWSGKVGPRKAGAAAEQPCGGGAAWLGRELELAEVAVGRRSGAGGSLYRASKAVELCGAGGRLASIAGHH